MKEQKIIKLKFKGEIVQGYYESYRVVFIKQPDGYEIPLHARFQEIIHNYGNKVTVRYWTSKKKMSEEEMKKTAILEIMGCVDVDQRSYECQYSEYTRWTEYQTIFNIGHHDLHKDLYSRDGQHLLLELEFIVDKD